MSGGLILDLFGFPMGSPIPYRIASELPARPPVTAGTDEAERVTLQDITEEPVVIGPETFYADDGDRMEHERKARLRRWQAVGERRT